MEACQPRQRRDKPGKAIKYEAPPQCPDGGGLLLPHIPDRYWELICQRHGLLLFLPVEVGCGTEEATERCYLEGVGHLVRVTVQLLEQV